ncbi:MAG: hypothetical protein CMP48_22780 [Rickettsiales bacterium]|nr:hypothetical protein [Rickettsiales bacterium]
MEDRRIDELQEKLQGLIHQQHKISNEIRELQIAVDSLKQPSKKENPVLEQVPTSKPVLETSAAEKKPRVKRDLEQFIGENLISKLGILITVIGVGIGTKYAIDNEMINPVTRIILGYLVSLGLLGFAIFLKKNYLSFSAVLLSGAFAIMYFLTFAAYNFYGFIGKGPAFGVMVILTVATVYSALRYDKSIIAHMGLVGSYAVPFLLSDGSGQVLYLFIYITIINIGIVVVSVKKYWQSLYYAALIFTWLIYTAWFLNRYTKDEFTIAILFAGVFFILFYTSFLANKVLFKKELVRGDIFLILTNSLIFYSLSFALLDKRFGHDMTLGLFTLGNSALHFLVAFAIKRINSEHQALFRLIVGVAIAYLTLTIPVIFEGAWITVLWVGEAAALTWAGQPKEGLPYRRMSYVLILLTSFSLFTTWINRSEASSLTPFFNTYFLVNLLSIAGLSVVNWLNYRTIDNGNHWYDRLFSFIKPGLLLLTVYACFALEIAGYWQKSPLIINGELLQVWLMIYSLVYLGILALFNQKTIQSKNLTAVILVLGILTIPTLLNTSYTLNEIRQYYLEKGNMMILSLRYFLFAAIAFFGFSIKPYFKKESTNRLQKNTSEIILLGLILWITSIELIHWLDLFDFKSSDKLSLTILWGISALAWIGLGITQLKKHVRVVAIGLFAVALIKLFFYDIAHLDNLSKTIVFVSLGILMLVASFLYNRFMKSTEESQQD